MAFSLMADFTRVLTTSTGTGNLTVSSGVTGYQSFDDVGFGTSDYFYYTIFSVDAAGNPAGSWETGLGNYNSTTNVLQRSKVLASSNSGALVNFSSGNKHIIASAPGKAITPAVIQECRLTLSSNEPVDPDDTTGIAVVNLVPYCGDILTLFNGVGLERYRLGSLVAGSLSLTLTGLTSGKNYDVYGYTVSGIPRIDLAPAWTTDTARQAGIALAIKGGIYVNNTTFTSVLNGDSVTANTGTYLGTLRTTGTNTTEDSKTKRFLWNNYNRAQRQLKKNDTTASWNYTTATWRAVNGASGNKVEYVIGLTGSGLIDVTHHGLGISSSGASLGIGIGLDWASGAPATPYYCQIGGGGVAFNRMPGSVRYCEPSEIGYHYLQMIEIGGANGTFLGSGTTLGNGASMQGFLMG